MLPVYWNTVASGNPLGCGMVSVTHGAPVPSTLRVVKDLPHRSRSSPIGRRPATNWTISPCATVMPPYWGAPPFTRTPSRA